MEPFRLDGQVALITGAAGGLGSAIARAFGAAGADLALAELPGRLEEARDLAAAVAAEHGRRAVAVPLDVTDLPGIERAVAEAEGALGGLDVLVANAGVNVPRAALDVTEADWDRVLDVDLKGVFFSCQAAGRRMVAQGRGSIVTIASQNGVIGYPYRAAYCAAKAGVVNLTRVLALEWAARGVRVNAVGPTFVETSLTQVTLADPALRADILGRIPLGRLGTPEEVASAVLFLASPGAALITGTCLLADGGWTAI
ncbi:MAG TPA: SDR family NAD(P)-dependent oxidoreductase [Chloroflexota bacterium]|nr:SDR family NAD(P)-dependent oxidoreductase [Chloroflexota bacterium]